MFCLAKKLPRSLNAPEPNILVYQFFFVKHPAIHSQKKPPLSAHFSAKKLPEGGIIPGCQMAGFGVAGTLDAP
jgi:hypothetical protein